MRLQHYSFPSIEQFKGTIRRVADIAEHDNVSKPKLAFIGTVKLHGTNAGLQFDLEANTVVAQSRSGVITSEVDNNGFARWAELHQAKLLDVAGKLALCQGCTKVVVFGEWCGGNIQKGVAINKLPKMFVVFAVAELMQIDVEEIRLTWFSPNKMQATVEVWHCPELPMSSIYSYPTFKVDIDFEHPEQVQNKLVELTNSVEVCCPVGQAHGSIGVGEGIVWQAEPTPAFNTKGLTFKVKGEKHSDTKSKQLVPIDEERVAGVAALADLLITEYRLEKGIEAVKLETGVTELNITHIGAFLKWVSQDVIKEDSETITANNFERKEVIRRVDGLARTWFLAIYC